MLWGKNLLQTFVHIQTDVNGTNDFSDFVFIQKLDFGTWFNGLFIRYYLRKFHDIDVCIIYKFYALTTTTTKNTTTHLHFKGFLMFFFSTKKRFKNKQQ